MTVTSQHSMPADILPTKAVAARLQVAEQTLAKWRTEGIGPRYLRMGRTIRYRASDVDAFIEQSLSPIGGPDEAA